MTNTIIMMSLMIIAILLWCVVDDYFRDKDAERLKELKKTEA